MAAACEKTTNPEQSSSNKTMWGRAKAESMVDGARKKQQLRIKGSAPCFVEEFNAPTREEKTRAFVLLQK
jgi:hypothetical protein